MLLPPATTNCDSLRSQKSALVLACFIKNDQLNYISGHSNQGLNFRASYYRTLLQSGIVISGEIITIATNDDVLHNVPIRDSHILIAVLTATDDVELHSVTIRDIHIHRLEFQG